MHPATRGTFAPTPQAAFGDLLFEVALSHRKCFLIETHSDYLVDRFRLSLSKSNGKVFSKLFFFQKDGRNNKVDELQIAVDGKYPVKQPPAFREFFIHESLRVLDM